MKKILMCTAAATMLAGSAFADNGAYVGLGLGNTFANANAKIDASGEDSLSRSVSLNFGTKKLKDTRAVTGKLFGGYEFDLSDFSVLTEVGFTLDDTEAKHNTALTLTGAVDDGGNAPIITSTRLKRDYTFSIGAGVKKEFADKFSALAGVDVLYSRFEIKSKGQGTFDDGLKDVRKKRAKFGIAPWIGAAWDLGFVETGLRYQYAKYQTIKNAGDGVAGSANSFAVSNKVKPAYHTVMLTVSKKF
tara:strand:+ start:15693 stop:16430 length:738 start_codon:yes stop_codon:yes gene_type:complete